MTEIKTSRKTERFFYTKPFIFTVAGIYFIAVFGFAILSYHVISRDTQKELGEKARVLAIDVAQRLEMNSSEFNRLLGLEFNELLKDMTNIEFERNARAVMKFTDIKYIYLESPLADDKIKYRVGHDETEVYEAREGTPLNGVYLLDAVRNDWTRWEDTNWKWYADKDRYTVLSDQYYQVYNSLMPAVIFNSDQWGTYITGYSPYFDDDNVYRGLIGVDIFLDHYLANIRLYVIILSGFVFVLISIGVFALYLILRVKRTEHLVEEKSYLSNIDSLTSLLNRRALLERMRDLWEISKQKNNFLSLLLIDVDYFKGFNDNYGHIAGDEVLRRISGVLEKSVRHDFDYVGRFGGDEFIVLLNNTDSENAQTVANNLIKKVRDLGIERSDPAGCGYVTVTIGFASQIPGDELSPDDFFHMADNALYQSKKYGRNQVRAWDKTIPDVLHRPFFPEVKKK